MVTPKGIQRKIKKIFQKRKKKFLYNLELAKSAEDPQLKLMALRYLAHQLEKVIKHQHDSKIGIRGLNKSEDAKLILKSLQNTKYDRYPDVIWAKSILESYDLWCSPEKLRQKLPPIAAEDRKTDFYEIINSRRSIRFWKSKSISNKVIKNIIELGIKAPSSCNRQTWKFTVIKNLNSSNADDGVSNPKLIAKAPYILYVSIDMRMYSETYSPAIDVGLVTQNILLAMESHNISACPIYHSESYNQKKLRKQLSLDKHDYIYLALPFGYADEKAIEPKRVLVEEILSFIEVEDSDILNVHY